MNTVENTTHSVWREILLYFYPQLNSDESILHNVDYKKYKQAHSNDKEEYLCYVIGYIFRIMFNKPESEYNFSGTIVDDNTLKMYLEGLLYTFYTRERTSFVAYLDERSTNTLGGYLFSHGGISTYFLNYYNMDHHLSVFSEITKSIGSGRFFYNCEDTPLPSNLKGIINLENLSPINTFQSEQIKEILLKCNLFLKDKLNKILNAKLECTHVLILIHCILSWWTRKHVRLLHLIYI